METMTISVMEYRELVSKAAAIDAFARYVNDVRYSIGRNTCGAILGFEVEGDDSDKS